METEKLLLCLRYFFAWKLILSWIFDFLKITQDDCHFSWCFILMKSDAILIFRESKTFSPSVKINFSDFNLYFCTACLNLLLNSMAKFWKCFPSYFFSHLQSAEGLTYSYSKNNCVAGILGMPAYQWFFKEWSCELKWPNAGSCWVKDVSMP